jgi:CheY-like chemotaxis protein
VHITLPAMPPTVRAQPPLPVPLVETAALRVLVVDDEPEVRTAVADMLGSAGYTTFEAAGGREALAWLDGGQSVDLLLTDLGMPGMTARTSARP